MVPPVRFFVSFVLALSSLSVFCATACAGQEPVIRVALVESAGRIPIDVNGSYCLKDPDLRTVLASGTKLDANVRLVAGAFLVGANVFNCRSLVIEAEEAASIRVNRRPYRGTVKLIRASGKTLTAVNYLPLEEYVKGISVRETSPYWPPEALEAQAIVFRTFAWYRMEERRNQAFDVSTDVSSQVYGGRSAERYRIISAVDQTRGRVLEYRGAILPAFFHSTCAGFTESAKTVWGLDRAPLAGVRCGFCQDSPHTFWKVWLSRRDLYDRLHERYASIGDIKELIPSAPDPSGRRVSVTIVSSKGSALVPAGDFRMRIGADIIRSTNFTVSKRGNGFFFEGRGWGHGVGLCQWGAYGMAKAGRSAGAILQAYYPASRIKTVYP